jgi:hypothetical protein
LQFATYYDASDQASLSRLTGGIHPSADDFPGRRIGSIVGSAAWREAQRLFGIPEPASVTLVLLGTMSALMMRRR